MSDKKLASDILANYRESSELFSTFQKKAGPECPAGCGKCCMKKDIACAPYELLPLALHLIEINKAEEILERARNHQEDRCIFLEVTDKEKGLGICSEYQHRPFICRAFGVAARHDKNHLIEYSLCKVFKEDVSQIRKITEFEITEIPFIEILKSKLQALDPRLLETEIPIHQGIVMLLEKILLRNSLEGSGVDIS